MASEPIDHDPLRRRISKACLGGMLLSLSPSMHAAVLGAREGTTRKLPAWVRALTTRQWSQVAGTALASSPALYVWPGGRAPGRPSGIVDAWGGWAVDEATNRIWLQGGGHSDYGGNELYMLDLRADAPTWSLAVEPTPLESLTRLIDGRIHSKWNKDGTPVAAHIYWSAHFVGGRIYRTPYYADFGAIEAGRHAFAPNNEAWLPAFDTVGRKWDAPDAHALLPNYSSSDPGSGGIAYAPCCSDGERYYAVLLDRSVMKYRLCCYDPTGNVWEAIGDASVPPIRTGGTFPGSIYDSRRRELVLIGEKSDVIVQRYDLDSGERRISARTGVEFARTWDSSYSGVCYDRLRDKYYLYSGRANADKNLYVIDPAAGYKVSVMSELRSTQLPLSAAGVNSRFKYIQDYDLLLMQPTYDSNLWALRLS